MAERNLPVPEGFGEVVSIIQNARNRALRAVNAELIRMYWDVGEYLSRLCEGTAYGDRVIRSVAEYIAEQCPGIKGFNVRGLYRMKQFYEIYSDDEIVSTLLTQISWSNHLIILSGTRTKEERQFYLELCVQNHYSARELQRQIDSAYYLRHTSASPDSLKYFLSLTSYLLLLTSYFPRRFPCT